MDVGQHPRGAALLAAIVSLCAAVVLVTPAANAGHGSTYAPPDDTTINIDRNDLTAGSNTAVARGIAQLDRTDLNATTSGSGDIEVYDGYYGTSGEWNDRVGYAPCVAYTAGYAKCTLYWVQFNLSYSAGYGTGALNSLGCHEFGHTGGLGHRNADNDTDNNSCMRSAISSNRQSFDAHDLDAINNAV